MEVHKKQVLHTITQNNTQLFLFIYFCSLTSVFAISNNPFIKSATRILYLVCKVLTDVSTFAAADGVTNLPAS